MADADVPIPPASGDRRIEATPMNLSCVADLTGNIGSYGNPAPVSCLPINRERAFVSEIEAVLSASISNAEKCRKRTLELEQVELPNKPGALATLPRS